MFCQSEVSHAILPLHTDLSILFSTVGLKSVKQKKFEASTVFEFFFIVRLQTQMRV